MQPEWSAPNDITWFEESVSLAARTQKGAETSIGLTDIEKEINRAAEAAVHGDINTAISILKPLLRNRQYRAAVHNNLGVLYSRLKQAKRGYRHFCCALVLNPDYPEALINTANYLCWRDDLLQAETHYKRALAIRGESAKLLGNLGHCLMQMNRLGEAQEILSRAVSAADELTTAHFNLACVFLMLGEFDQAQVLLRQITTAAPTAGAVQRTLANSIRFTPDSEDLVNLQQAFKASPKRSADRMHLAFALGKAYEDIKRPSKAFRYINLANALLRQRRPYDSTIQQARFTSNLRLFNQSFHHRPVPESCQSEQRIVFLIGLPRCGSTLIHQILSMHPDIKACGESIALGSAILKEKARDIASNPQAIARIRDAYLQAHSNPGGVIVDKNLYNFYWAPLIKKVFPRAILLEIERERYGHFWSMYKNYFSHGNEFTASLEWIAEFSELYHNMMKRWREELGLDIGRVCYEDLVSDPTTSIRKLLDLCGLSWHDDCMNHNRSSTPVRTASVYQVRKSIYQTSAKGADLYIPLIKKSLELHSTGAKSPRPLTKDS